MEKVFLSYAHDAEALAKELIPALQQHEFQPLVDLFRDPTKLWKNEAEHAIDEAECCLIFVSPESYESRVQQWEWQVAVEKSWTDPKKTLIALLVGEVELPPFLRRWVSLRIDPAANPDWSGQVIRFLAAGSNGTSRDFTRYGKQERQLRLDQLTRAVEELRVLEMRDRYPEANTPH